MAKRGKQPKAVEVAGESIEGLYEDKCLKVYYFYKTDPITRKRKKITRRNKAKAALELYNYNLERAEVNKVKVPFDYKPIKGVGVDVQGLTTIEGDTEKAVILGKETTLTEHKFATHLPENIIIEQFTELLDTNPRKISETYIKMGREDLAGIIHLPKNYKVKRTKLSDLLEWYLTDEERSKDTIKYAKLFWNQFCDIINVPYLEQISIDHIKAYKAEIERIKEKDNRSPKWLKSRYEMVKRLVRNAGLHQEDKTEVNRVLINMALLKTNGSGKDNRKNPKPMASEEFNIFLSYAKEQYDKAETNPQKIKWSKWIAILLLGANTCSYFQDIVDMEFVKAEGQLGVDLDSGTLSMYREKKNTSKVAVLWTETVSAIRQYRHHLNSTCQKVFISRDNNYTTAKTLRTQFLKINIELIKLNPTMRTDIEFNQIRDAGFTACAKAKLHIEQRNYVSGHRNRGDDDNYLLREPELAEPACDAMYDYFMK